MTDVSISCLCGRIDSRVQLISTTPVETFLCHKTQCRRNLGALSHSPLPLKDRPVVEKLDTYFPPDGQSTRFFCASCGSHIFEKVGEIWYVQSGAVDEVHSEHVLGTLEQMIGHVGVEETADGGISPCFDLKSNETVEHEPRVLAESTSASGQLLEARCVCGGVDFRISRPNSSSVLCSSPWPDLIVPYHKQTSDNPEDIKWWVKDHKWLAGTCACRSCRLGLGSPFQAWAFVSRSNLMDKDGSPLIYGKGAMRAFSSSPGVQREFCGKCGATIFWHNEERPGVVDVSVGILRASEGALARNWLSWWFERVSFAEEAIDKRLVAEFEDNLHRIRQRV